MKDQSLEMKKVEGLGVFHLFSIHVGDSVVYVYLSPKTGWKIRSS